MSRKRPYLSTVREEKNICESNVSTTGDTAHEDRSLFTLIGHQLSQSVENVSTWSAESMSRPESATSVAENPHSPRQAYSSDTLSTVEKFSLSKEDDPGNEFSYKGMEEWSAFMDNITGDLKATPSREKSLDNTGSHEKAHRSPEITQEAEQPREVEIQITDLVADAQSVHEIIDDQKNLGEEQPEVLIGDAEVDNLFYYGTVQGQKQWDTSHTEIGDREPDNLSMDGTAQVLKDGVDSGETTMWLEITNGKATRERTTFEDENEKDEEEDANLETEGTVETEYGSERGQESESKDESEVMSGDDIAESAGVRDISETQEELEVIHKENVSTQQQLEDECEEEEQRSSTSMESLGGLEGVTSGRRSLVGLDGREYGRTLSVSFLASPITIRSSEDFSMSSEETKLVSEHKLDVVERAALLRKYNSALVQKFVQRRRSAFLMNQCLVYYRSRKVAFGLKTGGEPMGDKVSKYQEQLLEFDKLNQIEERKRSEILTEIGEMKERRYSVTAEINHEFKKLTDLERKIGIGLISTKTGKPLAAQVVDHLISTQKRKLEEMWEMCYQYTKMRDKVTALEKQIRQSDFISDGMSVGVYQQMRRENEVYFDRLDEKEREMKRLKEVSTAATQSISHIMQELHLTEQLIEEVHEQLGWVEVERNNRRERLTKLRSRQNWLRHETDRLRYRSGLLIQQDLQQNFIESKEECAYMINELNTIKNKTSTQRQSIKLIRDTIKKRSQSAGAGWTDKLLAVHHSKHRPSSSPCEPHESKTPSNVSFRARCSVAQHVDSYEVVTTNYGRPRLSFLPPRLSTAKVFVREFGDKQFCLPPNEYTAVR